MANARDILIRLLGHETVSPAADRAARAVDDLGDAMGDAGSDAQRLDLEIERAERSLRDLAVQFARTQDEADRIDLSKQIRRQQSELRKLTKVKGLLGSAAKAGTEIGAAMATGAGGALSEGVKGTFGALPPQVQAAVVAAGAAIGASLASVIGAALASGVLLAVGGGVLAAGIKAAADSPEVKAAWSRFGERAKNALAGFGTPFEAPLIRAAGTFASALERMAPALTQMGQQMAPVVDHLAPALAAMAEETLPGIQKALTAGQPLWDTLADQLPELGYAMSRFFAEIADGAPGANAFLGDFLDALKGLLIGLGVAIGTLANMYRVAREVWEGVAAVFATGVSTVINNLGMIVKAAAKSFGWIPGIGPKVRHAAKEFEKFRARANNALAGIKDQRVNVDVNLRGIRNLEERMAVRLGRRASGGPVDPNTPYLVGEEGPELVTPSRHGYVHDARATARMLAGEGRPLTAGSTSVSSGPQPLVVRVEAGAAAPMERAFADLFLGLIRTGALRLAVDQGRIRPA